MAVANLAAEAALLPEIDAFDTLATRLFGPADLDPDDVIRDRRERAAVDLDRACDLGPYQGRLPLRLVRAGYRWRKRALRIRSLAVAALTLPRAELRASWREICLQDAYDLRDRADAAGRAVGAPGVAAVAPLHGGQCRDDDGCCPEGYVTLGSILDRRDTPCPYTAPVHGQIDYLRLWPGPNESEPPHAVYAVVRYWWRASGQPAFEGALCAGELSGPCRWWLEGGSPDPARSGIYVEGRRVSGLLVPVSKEAVA